MSVNLSERKNRNGIMNQYKKGLFLLEIKMEDKHNTVLRNSKVGWKYILHV